MPLKPGKNLFEYAVVRYVPDIERGEFINVGLVMMCKRRRWLQCRMHIAADRIVALFPEADLELLGRQLDSFRKVSEGDSSPIGSLEAHERFSSSVEWGKSSGVGTMAISSIATVSLSDAISCSSKPKS